MRLYIVIAIDTDARLNFWDGKDWRHWEPQRRVPMSKQGPREASVALRFLPPRIRRDAVLYVQVERQQMGEAVPMPGSES